MTVDCSVECWAPVPILGYEELYLVSNFGEVKSLPRTVTVDKASRVTNSGKFSKSGRSTVEFSGKVMTPEVLSTGYLRVTLRDAQGNRKRPRIHQLVAKAFIPNPENKPEIDHIDGNRQNNRADNLRWVTHEENVMYARERNGNWSSETGPIKVLCADTNEWFESIKAAARWATGNDAVSASTLKASMAANKAYCGHVFVTEAMLSSIDNLKSYTQNLLAQYKANTPCEEKAIMGKRKRKKGWSNPAKKLFPLDGAVDPAS